MGNDVSLPLLEINKLSVTLRGKSLHKFPFSVIPNHPVESLDLSYNYFDYIPPGLPSLHFLDLSANALCRIPPQIENSLLSYYSLAELRLSHNDLISVPYSISYLTSLKTLILSYNKITKFRITFENLNTLDLSCNLISEFPEISDSLTTLNLNYNRLKEVHFQSSNLRQLFLAGNDIKIFPSDLQFENLQNLDISFNKLVEFENIVSIAPILESLNVSYNYLTKLPSPLPSPLRCLNANCNRLTETPDFSLLRNLKIIRLTQNYLTKMPPLPPTVETLQIEKNRISESSHINCSHLYTLNLNQNDLADIPNFSRSGTTSLILSRNPLTSLTISAVDKAINTINLVDCGLKEVPPDIFRLPQLKELYLCNNNLSKLPNNIERSSLSTFNISGNPISTLHRLPPTLLLFSACDCNFESIPFSLVSLPRLMLLNMSNNKITNVPRFGKLEVMFLSCNKIKEFPTIPDTIREIDLSMNNIKEAHFEHFDNLAEIDLSHNELTSFSIGTLPNLSVLKLAHNKTDFILEIPKYQHLDVVDIHCTNVRIKGGQNTKFPREIVLDSSTIAHQSIKVIDIPLTHAGFAEMRGTRETMEDSIIIRRFPKFDMIAVIDGHAGSMTSCLSAFRLQQYITEFNLNEVAKGIKKLNNSLRDDNVQDGATLAFVLKTKKHLIAANIGDSRALIIRKNGAPVTLSYDHKPYERSEMEEIRSRGSYVTEGRVGGILAVSRALGDFTIPGVGSKPCINTYEIGEEDFALVVACDGVFDVLENEQVGKIVIEEETPAKAAYRIRNLAYARLSEDNISVIVVNLQ